MEGHRVKRGGDKDLVFDGMLLGEGQMAIKNRAGAVERGTAVEIFRTEGGQFVIAVEQWKVGGEPAHRAGVVADPPSVYDWLVADCKGKLGPAAKEAWEGLCAALGQRDEAVEVVE